MIAALLLVGCSENGVVPVGATNPTNAVPGPVAAGSGAASTDPLGSGELRSGSLQRVVKAGPITINARYSTELPVTRWTWNTAKPVTVSLSAIDNQNSRQRIYLSRVRFVAVATNGSDPIGDPVALSDAASITPGYLVNFPDSYSQIFTVPAVDQSATAVTMTFTYEVLALVDESGDQKAREYTKHTVATTIQVPLR